MLPVIKVLLQPLSRPKLCNKEAHLLIFLARKCSHALARPRQRSFPVLIKQADSFRQPTTLSPIPANQATIPRRETLRSRLVSL